MNIIELTNQQYIEKNAFLPTAIRAGVSAAKPFVSRAIAKAKPLITKAQNYTKSDAFKTGLKATGGRVVENLATSSVTDMASSLIKSNPPPAIKPMGVNNPTFRENSVFNRGSMGG